MNCSICLQPQGPIALSPLRLSPPDSYYIQTCVLHTCIMCSFGSNIFLRQYLPMATLLAGVKSGQLHQGHFNANQYNYLEVDAFSPIAEPATNRSSREAFLSPVSKNPCFF